MFRHWPLASATLLSAPAAATAQRALTSLRRAAATVDSDLGLVLSERDLAGCDDANQERLRRAVARAVRVLGRLEWHRPSPKALRNLEQRLLVPLASTPLAGRRLETFHLDPNDVLVVPTMGHLVSPGFVSAIRAAFEEDGIVGMRWVYRPRALGT